MAFLARVRFVNNTEAQTFDCSAHHVFTAGEERVMLQFRRAPRRFWTDWDIDTALSVDESELKLVQRLGDAPPDWPGSFESIADKEPVP